jgi:hypothetical protein
MYVVYAGITSANYTDEDFIHNLAQIGNSVAVQAIRTGGTSADKATMEVTIAPTSSRIESNWCDSGMGEFSDSNQLGYASAIIDAIRLKPDAGTWTLYVREVANEVLEEA